MENVPAKGPEVLAAALAAGVAGDLLLRAGPPGINLFLWAALLIALVIFLARGGPIISRTGDAVAAGAFLVFAAGFAWRAAPFLLFLDLFALGVVVALAALRAPVARLAAAGLAEYVQGALLATLHVAFGPFLLAFKDVEWKNSLRPGWFRRAAAAASGLLLSIPVLLLFAGLLMAADPVFAALVRRTFHLNFPLLFSHLFLICFFAWIAGGYLRGIFFFDPGSVPLPQPSRPWGLGITQIAVALGAVDVLFAVFVWIELRYFFGGAALVGVTPGLTYAEYARHGFFELAAVSALVLPLLLAAHWLLREGSPRAQNIFRVVAGIQVALIFVIMASALERMRLYQQAYGMTELRFYTTAFMAWLAVVFAWLSWTVLRGRRERFAFGALVAGFAAILVLNALNPDALIARVNARRAAQGLRYDAGYASFLSADAVPALIAALPSLAPSDRAQVARALLDRWASPRPSGWRSWNYSRSRARAIVTRHHAALDRLGH